MLTMRGGARQGRPATYPGAPWHARRPGRGAGRGRGGVPRMSPQVLVVDDDPAVLSGLRRALALEGYAVQVAESGETALALAAAEAPDLVVLDVMLPDLDGLTV